MIGIPGSVSYLSFDGLNILHSLVLWHSVIEFWKILKDIKLFETTSLLSILTLLKIFIQRGDYTQDYYFGCRRYLPVLKGFPARYIFEPWTAPESVQRAAHCIIGKDYPLPMVNHQEASRVNMERMMQVYQQLSPRAGKYGKYDFIIHVGSLR